MTTLPAIASALKSELEDHFATVRISAVLTREQFLRELKAVNPDKLPGVIIVFDDFVNLVLTRTEKLTLKIWNGSILKVMEILEAKRCASSATRRI